MLLVQFDRHTLYKCMIPSTLHMDTFICHGGRLESIKRFASRIPPPQVNSILSRVEYTVLQSELRKRCFSLIAY